MKHNSQTINYPFTAIAGQEKLKKALMLCAINPAIGGLLIQGDKGTAKSTAARALAEVVPLIRKENGEWLQVPFVNLPIGATEERIIGSLDLQAVLAEKIKKFQPGLLAAVHQGILYIDEVNLLPDHLVDVLLDVSAMGENRIEREGLSFSHPSRFTLIGTMNPEEGKLRPQFLDRFGLMVSVTAPAEVAERAEVVRRRIAFEDDPASFCQRWELQQQRLKEQLVTAKELLPSISMDDDLLNLISQLTTDLNVKSLRADIVIYKTAVTIAALAHRTKVTADDIIEAAELALGHRKGKNSPNDQGKNRKNEQDKDDEQGKNVNDEQGERGDHGKDENTNQQIFKAVAPNNLPKIESFTPQSVSDPQAGKRSAATNVKRGAHTRSEPSKTTSDIDIQATVVHAILRDPDQFNITIDDLHQKKRDGKMSNLILFVVDASGSMAARKRMEAVKGTVLSLLTEAYEKRDTVGVIAFRGIAAEVLLYPTQSIELAEEAMISLPTGGRTPLPDALQTAVNLLADFDIKKGYHPILVILTDGKANVPLAGIAGDPWNQTIQAANQLKALDIQSLVLNSESNYFNLDKAEELASALGGQYLSLSNVSEEQLTPIINQLSFKSS